MTKIEAVLFLLDEAQQPGIKIRKTSPRKVLQACRILGVTPEEKKQIIDFLDLDIAVKNHLQALGSGVQV